MADDFTTPLNELEKLRYAKVLRWRERGINPFPLRSARTHPAQDARAAFEHGQALTNVQLAGRLIAMREMGRITFAHLQDGSGKIQLLFRKDQLGADAYVSVLKDFDIGDFISVRGNLMATKTGEITLLVAEIQLLAKAVSPMPEKWHGLKDVETRYRQRYLDLMASEEVRRIFVVRAKIITAMRKYLDARGFLEVETPTLQPLYGGATARPFITHHNELDRDLYLRIATELYLKRLLVGGFERVYEIGKDFRNEGVDHAHVPEFTMMECYQAYADYSDMMKLVEEIVAACAEAALGTTQVTFEGQSVNLTPPWNRVTMRDALLDATGIDIDVDTDLDALNARIEEKNLRVERQVTWGKQVDELMSTFVQPNLIQPTFILDYPEEISPFAKKKPGNPRVVERFEPFVGGMEIGNAFTELNDPEDQYLRFVEQLAARQAGDLEAHQMDEDYVQALKHGMPPTGGLGLGVDRITMLLTDQHSIREVILFPQLRT